MESRTFTYHAFFMEWLRVQNIHIHESLQSNVDEVASGGVGGWVAADRTLLVVSSTAPIRVLFW